MALATRCPQCGTTFKVAHDQLKLRAGMVRCGSCKQVFNGIEHLVRNHADEVLSVGERVSQPAPAATPAPTFAPAPTVAPPAPTLAPAPTFAPPAPEQLSAHVDRVIHPPEPSSAPVAAAMPLPTLISAETVPLANLEVNEVLPPSEAQVEHFEAKAIEVVDEVKPEAVHTEFSFDPRALQQGARQEPQFEQKLEQKLEQELEQKLAPKFEPKLEPQFDSQTVDEESLISPRESREPHAVQAKTYVDDLPDSADSPEDSPNTRPELSHIAHDLPESDAEEPEFVKRGRRAQGLRRVARVGMLLGTFVLSLGVIAQATYAFRSQIAAQFPPARPWLEQACAQLACQVGFPSQIKAVALESDELQIMPRTRNLYALTTLLRNHGRTVQSWPHIELSLNDANDKPQARRVFAPREYLTNPADEARGFAAAGEQPVKIYFEVKDIKASGYRVYLFYP